MTETGTLRRARPREPSVAEASIAAIVTVLDEQKNIRDLLDSLAAQAEPFEVVVVDAGSTDGTWETLQDYAEDWGDLQLHRKRGQRGACRNFAVEQTDADAVAFIDGDCIANPFWAEHLREGYAENDIVAGRTIDIGYWAFETLQRVELERNGTDVTYPSCNLLYDRELFEAVGGFDDAFVTAEDIDLNLRAVDAGHTIAVDEDAIVYHRARDSFTSFFQQAYWNGYGRKQLTLKHGGRLWQRYSFRRMLDTQMHFWGLARLAVAAGGYMSAYVGEDAWSGTDDATSENA
ncbi:glycosyl transferase family 2 [Thermoplasmatales archaeon SW_10_69_26]|nr:MAG: glycosyl transferase family 2 [Thermoplasmatales archaeon SW_10_69_26]